MGRAARLALLVVGSLVGAYGASALIGERRTPPLGPPPWWMRAATDEEILGKYIGPAGLEMSVEDYRRLHDPTRPRDRVERACMSLGVTTWGLVLASVAGAASLRARRARRRTDTDVGRHG